MLKQRHGTRLIFFVMFAYILASFGWWSILFLRNNKKEFEEDTAAYKLEWVRAGNEETSFELSPTYEIFEKELRKRNMMILGEGMVFLTLISIGFWRINASFQQEIDLTRLQNNFLLSITHELKSPLASIKLSMETVLRRQLDPERVNRIAHISLEEVDRLETLVENILLASRIENPEHRFHLGYFDLSKKVNEISMSWDRKYPTHKFELKVEKGLNLEADPVAIPSVITNLVENAVKYAPNETAITVQLFSDKGQIVFQVSDVGDGIADEEKLKIFQRFYRVGNENTRKSKGTGLGLFIVYEIVRAHNGTIEISDNTPQGAVFTVRFPRIVIESALEDIGSA
ncbi:MAG: signal transduction histidine kinase [Limisphaerales bacterium]